MWWCWLQLLIYNWPNPQKNDYFYIFIFSPFNHRSIFVLRSAAEIGSSVLDSTDTEEMDVRSVKGKSFISVDPLGQVDWSWAFWFGFYFAFFFPPPVESTLLSQLLQTERVMGVRFCPDKGVRTLSLLLTPLSHQWDQGARGKGHWGAVSQSLPPSSCLKPSATELPLASLYLIPTCSEGSMDSVVRRHIHYLPSYQM